MKFLSVVFLSISVLGCAVGPDYETPNMQLPENFANANPTEAKDANLSHWWENFNDPTLNYLVAEALVANNDMKAAESRIREARSLLGISWSSLLVPQLEANASYARRQNSENAFGANNPAQGGGGAVGALGEEFNFYDSSIDSFWEIDIFGGKRRRIEAARRNYEAKIEDKRNIQVVLLSELGLNYINLRGLQKDLDITNKNITIQKETLEIQRMRLKVGLTNDLTVAQAEAQLHNTESALPLIKANIKKAIHRMSILLDREPSSLQAELEIQSKIPIGPPTVPAGIPSELLLRRPDVRVAERQLALATANTGVAVADFFPKVNLTGSLGLRSQIYSKLNEGSSEYWSFGPNVSMPIFDLVPLWANYKATNERQEQAFFNYRKAVLIALEDVENALTFYEEQQKKRQSLSSSVEANTRSVDLAKKLDNAGATDFLNVLVAQQALFRAESELVASENAVSTSLVTLYKALGGGWEEH